MRPSCISRRPRRRCTSASLIAVRAAQGLQGRLLRGREGAHRQAHASVRASSDASSRRCPSSWPTRSGSRTMTSTSTTTCAASTCASRARWQQLEALRRAIACEPARPQPTAVGGLRLRGPGRRPSRLLLEGSSQRHRRQGGGRARQGVLRHHAANARGAPATALARRRRRISSAWPSCCGLRFPMPRRSTPSSARCCRRLPRHCAPSAT